MLLERPKPQTVSPPLAAVGLMLGVAALLAGAPSRGIAANSSATLVQPSSSGEAKSAREALLKQRTNVVAVGRRHPGKTVGSSAPPPRTIVTRRFLPK
jgi:hypothetical protein